MLRKIDLGEDLNVAEVKKGAAVKPQSKFMMDDLAKTSEEALNDARKVGWLNWINSEPLISSFTDEDGSSYLFHISDEIKDRVVLLDFWDYTLLPCRRNLSYIKEWHRRYSSAGFVIIGVHSPRFPFGKDKKNVMDACRALDIEYPVVMDNDFEIWRSVENRFWPRRILFNSKGKVQLDWAGEGNYEVFEKNIQNLLRDLSPGLACPPIMKPLRKIDNPSYEIPSTTSEIFLGAKFNPKFANTQNYSTLHEEIEFTDDSGGNHAPDIPYLEGGWMMARHSIYGSPTFKGPVKLTLNFTGTDLYLVASSKAKAAGDIAQFVKLNVMVDRKPILPERLGPDAVLNEYRRSTVTVRDPRLYHIVKDEDHKAHEISIEVPFNMTDALDLYGIFVEHNPK